MHSLGNFHSVEYITELSYNRVILLVLALSFFVIFTMILRNLI